MNRIWELLLGLDRGFLARDGDVSLSFDPAWPGREAVGDATWNVVLVALAVALVVYVYRREGGRSTAARAGLAVVRGALLVFLIALLNRPSLALTQERVEPSVLAVMVDDSASMRVRDAGPGGEESRLTAAEALTSPVARELAKKHELRFYKFDAAASAIASPDPAATPTPALQADGQSTDLGGSLQTVLEDLQGQRVAGVVVLTDGRDTPSRPAAEALGRVVDFGVKVYPVPLGSGAAPKNVDVQAVTAPDGTFVGDVADVRATVRATGYGPGRSVTVSLVDAATGAPIDDGQGGTVTKEVTLNDGEPADVDLQFKPDKVATLDLAVRVDPLPGELDEDDNTRPVQVAVLDAQVNVLFVDGYPRWDYRYLKNALIRDDTTVVSTLLTSADPGFTNDGNRPIGRFPITMEELLDYDVVIVGDVDPRQFTDKQLALMAEFVGDKGGGFAMVAGPQHSPQDYRNTPVELLLPVDVTDAGGDASESTAVEGFRPVLTAAGEQSGIFRFFPDPAETRRFLAEQIPPIFWYARGVSVKPAVGEALAVHPTDSGPDGRPAPILVAGRYGAGRTIFGAIDDSWRWRYYTGESVFSTYWVQQVRYLARGRKLGQRKVAFFADRPRHELGETVRLTLRVLDPQLLRQLPDRIDVKVSGADGEPDRTVALTRDPARPDGTPAETYAGGFAATRVGRFAATLPSLAPGVDPASVPVDVAVPQLELASPQVDLPALTRLAGETRGEVVPYADALQKLAAIPSAERRIPVRSAEPLWDSPLALVIFMGLITTEWVSRKLFGML